MSWTHSICLGCWNKRYRGRPVRIPNPETEKCCFCGALTTSGIYVRADPKTLDCEHEEDA